jgi:hypothetical protein
MNEEVKGESILRKKIQTAELFSKSQKKFKMPVFMFHWNVVEIFRDQELRTNTYTHCLSMDSAALSNKIATKNAINHYNIHQLDNQTFQTQISNNFSVFSLSMSLKYCKQILLAVCFLLAQGNWTFSLCNPVSSEENKYIKIVKTNSKHLQYILYLV